MTSQRKTITPGTLDVYPVLPLRDIVVFPHMIVPLFVGREKSIRALEEVMRSEKSICSQRRRTPPTTIRLLTPFFPPARWRACCNS